MPDNEVTPIEQEIGRRIGAQPRGNHIAPADLVALAVNGSAGSNYDHLMAHVVTCASCRALLRQFQDMERIGGAARQVSAATTRPPGRQRWALAGSLALATIALLSFGRLRLGWGPAVAALQDNGVTISLAANDRIEGLPNLAPQQQALIAATLRTGKLETPAVLAELRTGNSDDISRDAFTVGAPRATVVESTQPEFNWKMPAGAVACQVVLNTDNASVKGIKSKLLTAEHWKPKKPLTPGTTYSWQVIALDRAGNEIGRVPLAIGAARFKVLAKDRVAEIDHARATLGRSHLAMGVLYTNEGMLDDAEREFSELNRANADSALAQGLLTGVRAMHG